MSKTCYFVVIMLCVSGWPKESSSEFCQALSPVLKLSIISQRNHTGHWVAQIKFDHGGSDSAEELEAGPFEVDVEHDSAVCDGRETVKMVASIT
ncbi:unnamed protein product, partial [Timema podura]|nr:unnamed protein product [Timema podura]